MVYTSSGKFNHCYPLPSGRPIIKMCLLGATFSRKLLTLFQEFDATLQHKLQYLNRFFHIADKY
jgi:hypothetical protein